MSSFKTEFSDWEKRIIGKWIFIEANEKEITLKKVKEFEKNKSGLTFLENGDFIFRRPSGYCGTPPITFSDHRGTWKKIENKILVTKHETWSGPQEGKFLIKEVNDSLLVMKYLNKKVGIK